MEHERRQCVAVGKALFHLAHRTGHQLSVRDDPATRLDALDVEGGNGASLLYREPAMRNVEGQDAPDVRAREDPWHLAVSQLGRVVGRVAEKKGFAFPAVTAVDRDGLACVDADPDPGSQRAARNFVPDFFDRPLDGVREL